MTSVEERVDQILAAWEMSVDRRPAEPGGVGDLLHRRLGALRQQRHRGIEHSPPVPACVGPQRASVVSSVMGASNGAVTEHGV